MSHHHYTPVDELRSSTRFIKERGTDQAAIWNEQFNELVVEVHDDSLGGLGIYVKDAVCFVGQQLEVVYAGEFFRARVCHVEPQDNGEYIVGLDCDRIVR